MPSAPTTVTNQPQPRCESGGGLSRSTKYAADTAQTRAIAICGHDLRRNPRTVAIAAVAESTANHPSCEPSRPPNRTGPSNDHGSHEPTIVTAIAINIRPRQVRTSAHHSAGDRWYHRRSGGSSSSATTSGPRSGTRSPSGSTSDSSPGFSCLLPSAPAARAPWRDAGGIRRWR